MVGSNRLNSPDSFDELKVSEGDRHLILSLHFYTPFLLTHYRADWTVIRSYNGRVQCPCQTTDITGLENYRLEIVDQVRRLNGYYNRDLLLK